MLRGRPREGVRSISRKAAVKDVPFGRVTREVKDDLSGAGLSELLKNALFPIQCLHPRDGYLLRSPCHLREIIRFNIEDAARRCPWYLQSPTRWTNMISVLRACDCGSSRPARPVWLNLGTFRPKDHPTGSCATGVVLTFAMEE